MKADPDFHPLAAAWLDGTATPPEQKLLGEILHGPDMMREYAALSRTEALLHLRAGTAQERRRALSSMLAGRSRIVLLWKHPIVRWSAAAAALFMVAWVLWPSSAPEATDTARKVPVSPRIAGSLQAANVPVPSIHAREMLPPADKGVEQWLQRYYVSPFEAVGPLPDAAAALAAAIKLEDGTSLTADVRSAGDAPVHLKLSVSLPAWRLLELAAMQSGTEVVVSGKSVVFRSDPKPGSLEGTTGHGAFVAALRTLFAIPPTDPATTMSAFAQFALHSFGSRIRFNTAGEDYLNYHGIPRDLQVLDRAQSSIQSPPVLVSLSVKLVELAPGVEIGEGIVPASEKDGPALSGIFTDEQFQVMTRSLSGIKGVNLTTMSSVMARPSHEVKMQSNPGSEGFEALLVATVEGGFGCNLQCEMGWGVGLPGGRDPNASGLESTQVLLWSGQTLGVTGIHGPNGSKTMAYITATLVLPDGTPLPPPNKVPESLDSSVPPAPAGTEPAPREELPYGIPVIGKQGMVQSPYAPDKGMIDVEGFKRGTKAMCPYTGKHFRVP